jgi:hypothetical protein
MTLAEIQQELKEAYERGLADGRRGFECIGQVETLFAFPNFIAFSTDPATLPAGSKVYVRIE